MLHPNTTPGNPKPPTPSLSPSPTLPQGIVFDIQRGAMRDGPGIRTTVFLKGCPLRCAWCHNPESWSTQPQTGKSGKSWGRAMSVGDVLREVRRDRSFYEISGGGMTLSGGEPTTQFDFCLALLKAARAEGIATCLDTSGHVAPGRFARLLPHVDCFLFDLKAEPARYPDLAGCSFNWVGQNLNQLARQGSAVILRCPLVPGVNDSPAHFQHLRQVAASLPGLIRIDLLPYHNFGLGKADDLGIGRDKMPNHPLPTGEDLQRWKALCPQGCLAH